MLWAKQAVLAGILAGLSTPALADGQITAGSLSDNLNRKEQYAFLAGTIEGLAVARFLADGKKPDGMRCIYNWFYEIPGTQAKIIDAFALYPDRSPGQIMAVLLRKQCGA